MKLGLTTEEKLSLLERDIAHFRELRDDCFDKFEAAKCEVRKTKHARQFKQITAHLEFLTETHARILENYEIGSSK